MRDGIRGGKVCFATGGYRHISGALYHSINTSLCGIKPLELSIKLWIARSRVTNNANGMHCPRPTSPLGDVSYSPSTVSLVPQHGVIPGTSNHVFAYPIHYDVKNFECPLLTQDKEDFEKL
jgi:hypothetical protein